MAMNENLKNLLRSIAGDDLNQVKKYAKIIVSNETAQSNQHFCKMIKAKLDAQPNFIELPYDISGFLKMEDSSSFKLNRYFVANNLQKLTQDILRNSEVIDKLCEMQVYFSNSYLLSGESGTGKTTFGRYIAHTLNLPFAYLNFSQCINSLLGSTAKNLDKVFNYISRQKCVFMIDEIDAIGLKRGNEDLGEMSRIVISLMQSIDTLSPNTILLAATNRFDQLDDALVRRFTFTYKFKPLNLYEARNFIVKYLSDLDIHCSDYNIDYEYLAYFRMKNKEFIKPSTLENDIKWSLAKMLYDKTDFKLYNLGDNDNE